MCSVGEPEPDPVERIKGAEAVKPYSEGAGAGENPLKTAAGRWAFLEPEPVK